MSVQTFSRIFADFTPLEHMAVHTYVRLYYPGVDVTLSMILPENSIDHAGYWVWCPESQSHRRYTRDELVQLFGSAELAREFIRSLLRVHGTHEKIMSCLPVVMTY